MAALFGLIGWVRTGCVGAAAGLWPANRGRSPSPGSGRLRGTFLRYAAAAPARDLCDVVPRQCRGRIAQNLVPSSGVLRFVLHGAVERTELAPPGGHVHPEPG